MVVSFTSNVIRQFMVHVIIFVNCFKIVLSRLANQQDSILQEISCLQNQTFRFIWDCITMAMSQRSENLSLESIA